MEKILEIIQPLALVIFGICFLMYWETFADIIIKQNVKKYSAHKGKIKVLFCFIATVFILGGVKLLFFPS